VPFCLDTLGWHTLRGVCHPCAGHTLGLNFKLFFCFGHSVWTIKSSNMPLCVHYARYTPHLLSVRSFGAHTPHSLSVRSFFGEFSHITYIGTSHVMQCMHYSLALLSSLPPSPPTFRPRDFRMFSWLNLVSVLEVRETQFRPPGAVHKLIVC